MRDGFFSLRGDWRRFHSGEQLIDHLNNSDDLRDVLFEPDVLAPRTRNEVNPFINKTFANVSFSYTTISGVIFRDCTFVDVLFIGTHFVNCEFHGCSFKGCNPFKVEFSRTYIDPTVFEGMLDPVKHWNIGIYLFQKLYENSMDMHQRKFARSAEFNQRKWERYVLNHRYPGWKKTNPRYIVGWLANCLSYVLEGYGIRSKFFIVWAFVVVAGSVGANYSCWGSLNVIGKDGTLEERNWITILYYTVTIPSGLGDLAPASDMGRLLFVGETVFGLIIVALFAHLIIRRSLR